MGKSVKSHPVLSRRAAFALAILASTAWTPVALASEFPAVIPLSSLDGNIGFRLDGVAADDNSGYSVDIAGDVNGDGFDDIIIGACCADPHGNASGSTYVVFGKPSGFAAKIKLSSLDGNNGFRLDGTLFSFSGYSVAGAGDVNGDGFADLIVGANRASPHGTYSGSSYVVFGKAGGFSSTMDLSSLNGSDGFRLDGVAYHDFSGTRVASAGDVNGDGFSDVIVGAWAADPHGSYSGSSYVVFGKASRFAATIDLSTLNGDNGFRLDGVAKNDQSGYSVASAGDINGDGFDDVIVGARGADPHGVESGSTYVMFGKPSGFPAAIDLSSLNGTNGFRLDGASGDASGQSVASGGDINGDGFADLLIGAFLAKPSGSTYVVFGKPSGSAAKMDLSTLDGSNGFRLDDKTPSHFSGRSVNAAGDVNGDGFADLIIGAPNGYGSSPGGTYIVFGKASSFPTHMDLSSLNGRNGFRMDAVSLEEQMFFASVAGGGDINGDGFADVIIGAPFADPHGSNSGSSYVVFGRTPDSARTRIGSEADQYISGGAFTDTLKGNRGNDVLEGRGGADILNGGFKSDMASYLHSPTGVKVSLADPGKNTGDAAGDIYRSIEGVVGSPFGDTLTGNNFSNSLTGDQGADLLTGQGGPDLFVYNDLRDSPPGPGRDQITDFDAGTATTSVDKIDLHAIDSKTGPGNQAFSWIGTAAFSNTKGEVRVEPAGTSAVIHGDVDGDGISDLEIKLLKFTDLSTLTAIDFRL